MGISNTGADRGIWLVLLFLLVGVALPTGCVLWFMNSAAQSQAESARQSVMEAYRGQLRPIRDRLSAFWETRASTLKQQAGPGTPENFVRLVKAGLADSFVMLRADGSPAYPAPLQDLLSDAAAEMGPWRLAQSQEQQRNWPAAIAAYAVIAKSDADSSTAARAAQAHIRCLLQLPDRAAAIDAIREYFSTGRRARATDLQGRVIATDSHLLALKLMTPQDPRRRVIQERLTTWLNDYKFLMPSAQRLFLMSELRALGTEPEAFPTYDAERLAAQWLETDPARAGAGLESTRVPELWKLTAKGGRVVALLRNSTVTNAMRALLKEANSNPGVSFEVIPPGARQPAEMIAAGAMLPGWHVAFSLSNGWAIEEATRRRTTTYLWAGYLVIAAMLITGMLVGQGFRRQLRLARLKTDLVAAVSHELKTPLASMRLLVDSLLEDRELDPQKTRDYLALIAGENLRLTRLIENFLTFSRIERKRQVLEFTDCQPASIVQAAAAAVHERFQQGECRVEAVIESGLPAIHADRDALVTVLINLLDNAYKYTPGEKRIVLHAFRENQRVIFAVADNGIGIAHREQKRIFRKFYQVDQRLARETGGCGLGLSIVDHIVRAHGSSVQVESRPGHGSTFSFALSCRFEGRAAA